MDVLLHHHEAPRPDLRDLGGLLIATLQYTEYRFIIIEHSVELYSALVAILFATFGIWLGVRITRSRRRSRSHVHTTNT